jgi:hypothetical protein
MSIFAKKSDIKPPEPKQEQPIDLDVDEAPAGTGIAGAYGIADAMQLMRSLPVDQNIDLVVRVVRVTLGSVNVRIEDIVEDATRRQQAIQDNIAALHEQVADLEEELEARRAEILAHEADFKETTAVKERLQLAERSATFSTGQQRTTGSAIPIQSSSGESSSLPSLPPPPPARASLPKPSQRE